MNRKQKGKRGELEWASFCRQHGYDCRRTAQYCGNTGEASDVVGLPGIHQEVKRVEKLNIYEAMSQAVRDRKDLEIPVVAHRKNRFPWLVTMRADDWFSIYREFEAGNQVHIPVIAEHGANCPICGSFFNQEHADRKPPYCENCGCRLDWNGEKNKNK